MSASISMLNTRIASPTGPPAALPVPGDHGREIGEVLEEEAWIGGQADAPSAGPFNDPALCDDILVVELEGEELAVFQMLFRQPFRRGPGTATE